VSWLIAGQKPFRLARAWYNRASRAQRWFLSATRDTLATRRFDARQRTGKVTVMGSLGIPELLIVLAIVVLIFGANRLPELGRGIGKGIKNFKEASTSKDDES
jgi:sec-independent protein translocase protein TatA